MSYTKQTRHETKLIIYLNTFTTRTIILINYKIHTTMVQSKIIYGLGTGSNILRKGIGHNIWQVQNPWTFSVLKPPILPRRIWALQYLVHKLKNYSQLTEKTLKVTKFPWEKLVQLNN